MAGLFAYDVVGSFEEIGQVKRKNKCPDYVFYLADTILVSDHQEKIRLYKLIALDIKQYQI